MSLFEFIPLRSQLRTRVSVRTRGEDRARRQRISHVRLQVFDSSVTRTSANFTGYIKGLPFHDGNSSPFYWQFIPGDDRTGVHSVLRILLARGAYVPNLEAVLRRAQTAFPLPSSHGLYFPLALEITRVERTRLGLSLGQQTQIGSPHMSTLPWPTVARAVLGAEETDAFLLPALDRNPYLPQVTHLANGLLIEKASEGGRAAWQIRITTPLDQPAAFAYNLFGPTPPPDDANGIPEEDRAHLARFGSVYTLRVVKTLNVDVDLHVEMSDLVTSIDVRIEYHVVTQESTHIAGSPEFDLGGQDATPDEETIRWNHIGLVPEQGSYLSPRQFQFYTLTHQNLEDVPPFARTWSTQSLPDRQVAGDRIPLRGLRQGNRLGRVAPRIHSSFTAQLQANITVAELIIGLIPIVGTLYDIASILYLRATGRTFWGERREIGWMDLVGVAGIGVGIFDDVAQAGRGMQRAVQFYDRAVSRAAPIGDVLRHIDPPVRAELQPPPSTRTMPEPRSHPRRRVVDTSGFEFGTYSTRGQEIIRQVASRARAISARNQREVERLLSELDEHSFAILYDVLLDAPASAQRAILTASNRAASARAILDLDETLLTRLLANHERHRLLQVMSPDFHSFNNDLLNSGYQAHLSKRKARGRGPVSPLTWIRRQTRGAYHEELTRILGRDYRRRLSRGQALGTASDLDQTGLSTFERLHQDIVSYGELVSRRRDASTSTLDLGAFFDADHLLEKRFIVHLRERLPGFDIDSLNALLVPKHQGVMSRLRSLSPNPLRTYDHTTKTQLMRALIPYGEHELFSLQQWWDAHVWVYRQLEVADAGAVLDALESDFLRLSSQLGETFNPRRDIRDLDLLPSNQIGRASSTRP